MYFNKIYSLLFFFVVFLNSAFAQYDVPLYTTYTTAAARAEMYEQVIKNTITRNFSIELTDSTENYWEDAFSAMEVFNFKSPATFNKIKLAFDSFEKRSHSFQRALMEVVYTLYPTDFTSEVNRILSNTYHPKILAMSAEYVLRQNNDSSTIEPIFRMLFEKFSDSVYKNPILYSLLHSIHPDKKIISEKELLTTLLDKTFLPGETVMYSLQRKNRNYPGMVIIRNAQGKIVTDDSGKIFNIPQLARSISNLPYYLTNGNTPQGIYRMYGFAVSMSHFIGPTANVQMGMPVELDKKEFFGDSSINDSIWTIENYRALLPDNLKNYFPLFGSYYAGEAGRTEIIAHGTTIDPELYLGKSYYPLTPTQGCLCTKEIWNGKRQESDQQKLINALVKAGGGKGYAVVIEIDDKNEDVTLGDVQSEIENIDSK
jgi:hypothetical protein